MNLIAALSFRTTVGTHYWSIEADSFDHAIRRLHEHFGQDLTEIVSLGIPNHIIVAPENHLPLKPQISHEQMVAEEQLCLFAKTLVGMGVNRDGIIEQIDYALDELREQLISLEDITVATINCFEAAISFASGSNHVADLGFLVNAVNKAQPEELVDWCNDSTVCVDNAHEFVSHVRAMAEKYGNSMPLEYFLDN